jgi:hypothetical protein
LIVLMNCGMDWIWVEFYIEYIYRVPRAQTVLWIHDYIFCGQSDQSTWSQETCQPPCAAYTTSSHKKFQISWMATSWSLFVRPLPATILLKLLLLSMCNLQGVGTGGKKSVRQAIWFCSLFGCHFQVFKFGIAITQHLQWEDTG